MRIKYVAVCGGGEGLPSTLLDIHLENGHCLLLSLKEKQDDPAFLRLYREGELARPKTDGDAVFWRDGSRLSFAEIMEMARRT